MKTAFKPNYKDPKHTFLADNSITAALAVSALPSKVLHLIAKRTMAESPTFSDVKSDEEGEGLPEFEIESVETEDIQPTILFPHRKTSLERVMKSRKLYSEMIETALYQLNEVRTGSSRQAVLKYIRANFDVGENANRYVSLALAKLIEKERVVRKSGVGLSGRFSLSKEVREQIKKGKKPKAKPKAIAAKGTKTTAKGKGKAASEGVKAKGGKGKTKAKSNEEQDSDKENKPETKKTSNKNGRKAAGAKAKKGDTEDEGKTTNKKTKLNEGPKPKAKSKGSEKTAKESKSTTNKAKETKSAKEDKGQGKTTSGKGKASAKEKASEKEMTGGPSKKTTKSAQAKNAKKNEEKPTKQKAKH